jgi:hypothetical protein
MSQFPVWTAGQRVLAATLTAMEPLVVIKPADTSRASNTTLSNDPDLVFTNVGVGTYLFDGLLRYTGITFSTGPGDIKLGFAFSGSLSASGWVPNTFVSNAANNVDVVCSNFGTSRVEGTYGTGTDVGASVRGYLVVTAAGTMSLQWAQNTSNATATTMRAGSHLKLTQIA